ncbi:hypothetical protein AJ80_03302 [Polytolypa hystricis UAMH7299]|uniref:Uncharacterized protein n=1 Tax=Polytolypa hystricis (strain UAMH7299) TaxID=1447883 RepID=A0A2B7YJB1_POLH7|nr:hypothetical protein AJ80_03302 [Polytolypa hystricis UAMH7299]
MSISQIQLTKMPQLAEAVRMEDVWTGITDVVARKKWQNRLNVRAHREYHLPYGAPLFGSNSITGRRKRAAKSQPQPSCISSPGEDGSKDQQLISLLPASVARRPNGPETSLISNKSPPDLSTVRDRLALRDRIIFPLCPDQLITLVQFNALRGCLVDYHLLSRLKPIMNDECVSAALQVLPSPSIPRSVPSSLQPTLLQRTVPYRDWIDMVPHPVWRDNLILASRTFDEDELWMDTLWGLFEGFPALEVE